jgi:MFS family permease
VLFRCRSGAIPFLLPMMLQVGFGLSPFESGSLTFAAAAGALTMKLTAAPILRRFGFRRILCLNAVLSSALLAASALFTATTPHAIIVTVLLVAGFFRSLQFTSLNALGYADIETDQMSRATSFVAVVQQLALSSGVAIAAMLLEAFARRRRAHRTAGRRLQPRLHGDRGDRRAVRVVFYRLAPDAGAEVSGHRPAPR